MLATPTSFTSCAFLSFYSFRASVVAPEEDFVATLIEDIFVPIKLANADRLIVYCAQSTLSCFSSYLSAKSRFIFI